MARIVHVVDDDEAVRDSLDALLSCHGIDVRGYGSAAEFVASLPVDRDDCVLLDMHMPGTDGLQLAGMLRARAPALPIIMITGRSDEMLRQRAAAAGIRCLLDKPVDQSILLAAIDAAH
jgi:two-component system response regulator FixJ